MLFNRMFPLDSLKLVMMRGCLLIEVKPQFRDCYCGVGGIVVSSGGEISYPLKLARAPKTRMARWHHTEANETVSDEWVSVWKKRTTHKWDGKNPIVKALREMHRDRVGVRRGRSVGKSPRQRPLTKHKWK